MPPAKNPLKAYSKDPFKKSDFNMGVTIGLGSFGRVRLVTHKQSESIWALKEMHKAEVYRLKQVEHVLNEKQIMGRLTHPSAVSLAGSFQDERCLYLIMSFAAGGELYRHLRSAQRFDNNVAKFYAAQVVTFFEYFHSLELVYRDMKPENVLLDHLGYIKVTDFGFAKKVPFKTYTLCGTPEYMAPEIILSTGHGQGADWWALGVMIYEMLVGQPPFIDGTGPMGIYQQILNNKPTFPKWVNRDAKALIKVLMEHDLTRRLGCLYGQARDVKAHAWFSGLDWASLYDRELRAPLVPRSAGDPLESGDADTSNYDPYPDATEEPPLPSDLGLEPTKDPFADW